MTDISSLSHHGVKGMKWGVRKKYVREANANFLQNYYLPAAGQENQHHIVSPITEAQYKNLSSKPVKLGKDFLRVSANGSTSFRDIAYVSKTPDDHVRYTALIGGGYGGGKGKKHLSLKIKTADEVISPSTKARVDTYIETLGQDIPGKNGKTTKGRDWLHGSNTPYAKALNDRELGLASYKIWAQGQHNLKTPLETTYFKNLQKKGYNAVIDDADRGAFADIPVILFPRQSGATVTEVKPITKDDVIDAKRHVKRVVRREAV
jgi:hypothetical protein